MKICVNRKQFFLFVIFLLLDLFIIGSVTTHADENVINDKIQRGTWERYGNLQYGFSAADSSYRSAGVAPDVQLVQDNKSLIKHQYQYSNYLYSTSGFNLWDSSTINGNTGWSYTPSAMGFLSITNSIANFDVNTIKVTTLENGTNAVSAETSFKTFEIICTIFPDIETGNISMVYSIKNNSISNQTIYPSKGVDTMLAGIDEVPLYSIGPKEGVYMQTKKDNTTYRMDYGMNYIPSP